ncbi:MAG TPA: hypothetical protein VFZ69_10030 [Longimicrobiales bacterium]
MMNVWMTATRRLAAAAALTMTAACAPLGNLGGAVGGTGDSLYGEIRSVDTRRGVIQVREQYGRDYTVRYDGRTRVVYGQRQYPVSALERGDQVQMRIEYDRNNTPWADRIEVRDSRRRAERGDVRTDTRVQRVDGRVYQVDTRRGYFTLDGSYGRSLVVYVPRNVRREDLRRFDRLRRGDRVRVEIRPRGRDQADLVRFR